MADGPYVSFRDDALRYGVRPTDPQAEVAVDVGRVAEDSGASLDQARNVVALALAMVEVTPIERSIAEYAERAR